MGEVGGFRCGQVDDGSVEFATKGCTIAGAGADAGAGVPAASIFKRFCENQGVCGVPLTPERVSGSSWRLVVRSCGVSLLRRFTRNHAVSPSLRFKRAPSLWRLMPARRSRRPRRKSGWLNSSHSSGSLVFAAAALSPALVDLEGDVDFRLNLRNPDRERF